MTAPTTTRRLMIVGAVTLVGAVAVAVLFQFGRSSITPDPAATSTAPSTPSSLSPAPASPSTGSSEPGLPQGQARAGEGGTMTGPAGLPIGYTRDQTGAVQAATNYLIWMTSLRIADKTVADAMAAATAADPTTRSAMIDSFDQLRTGLGDVTEAQTEPARGAYAASAYASSGASIYVWAPDTTVDDGEASTVWGISEVRLVWRDGDWKLDGSLISRIGGAAVDPTDPEGKPSPEEKASILRRTPADPGEITDSAEQEWFEYANAAR